MGPQLEIEINHRLPNPPSSCLILLMTRWNLAAVLSLSAQKLATPMRVYKMESHDRLRRPSKSSDCPVS